MDRNNIEAIYPLSPMQQALLFASLAAEGAQPDPGCLQLRCQLEGDLHVPSFQKAWATVVERHAALRASVHWQTSEKPLQLVVRQLELPWTLQDWRAVPLGRRQERLDHFLRADRDRRLELSRAPVMRLALLRLEAREWQLVWSCHHVLLDGWSGALALREVLMVHEALRRGTRPDLPQARPYREYIAWLQRQDVSGHEEFWRRSLAGLAAPTPLPLAVPPGVASSPATEYGAESLELSRTTTASLQHFARRHRLTLGTVVQGAWAVLLGASAGVEEVCFGATVSGRSAPLPGIESMLGLFINVLPVRVALPRDLPVSAFLQRLQAEQAVLRQFEHLPLARIQEWSRISGGRLFESLVVIENFPAAAPPAGADPPLRIRELRSGITTGYPLTLVAAPGDPLVLNLVHDRRRLATGAAPRLLRALAEVLSRLEASTDAHLGELLSAAGGARWADGAPSRLALPLERGTTRHPLDPRDALELQLVQVWESVLGAHAVGVRDDFFALGGNSLTAALLFERIERVLGKRLPLATLFQAPTVEKLAAALRDQGWTPPWSSLVVMQPLGSRPPLFCIHSYEGHVLFYRDLARHLAPDQPVYGLQAVGFDGERKPLESVEEMASHYLQEIRAVQRQGPYLLAAMCFGISVAFEMAQQLRAQGEEVGELIVLDSGFLTLLPPWQPEAPRTGAARIYRRVRGHAGALKRRSLHAIDYLRQSPRARRERQLREAIERAWYRYVPRRYPGRVTLIRSAAYGAKQDWHLETWSALAGEGVLTREVPGDHLSMLQEPDVGCLAAQLRGCLQAGAAARG